MTAPAARPAWLLHLYRDGVALAGTAVLVLGLLRHGSDAVRTVDGAFVLLAVLLLVTELRPITLQRRAAPEMVNLSGAFACALVLGHHWSLVLVVQAVASLLDDAHSRVRWRTRAFNVGQYSLSLVAAALVLDVLSPAGAVGVTGTGVPAALAACAAFFAVNTVLPGVLFALQDGLGVRRTLLEDLPFQASVNGLVVLMAPLVAALAEDSLWLVLLVLAPVWAVHRAAVSSLQRDHAARHDPLTGLLNEGAFREQLGPQLADRSRDRCHDAVMVLSLDHFGDISHTLGQSAGDDLLRQVATRLLAAVPEGGVVARSGVGGYLVAVTGLPSPWAATTCAEDLLHELTTAYTVEESEFALRASVGLAVSPVHGDQLDLLLQRAEVARDVARRARTGVEVYSGESDGFTARRLDVLRGLRPALRRHELRVCFQPQVDLRTGAVTGYEALLRWDHPLLGLVPPDEFVPLAEHAGMMREITDHVLGEALSHAAAWRRAGSAVTVSVNVSASVLSDPVFPTRVARQLALWGVPSSALVIELTESAMLSDAHRCQQVMTELRDLQVQLSLDDYGTGYASLAYLTTLPVDELKIDKSFVLNMLHRPTDRVAVRSTIDLARDLGLRVVAEGVESAELAALLQSYGCRTVQGYHYGQAVPPQQVDLTGTRLPAPR